MLFSLTFLVAWPVLGRIFCNLLNILIAIVLILHWYIISVTCTNMLVIISFNKVFMNNIWEFLIIDLILGALGPHRIVARRLLAGWVIGRLTLVRRLGRIGFQILGAAILQCLVFGHLFLGLHRFYQKLRLRVIND